VETLAAIASEHGADARSATLLGYAQGLRDSIMLALPAFYEGRHLACERASRGRLGDAGFARAFERGATMPDGDAIAFVLEQEPASPAPALSPSGRSQPQSLLTRRELEIAHLIAEGLTSHQIAARLFISERTVTTHVTNMLNKLGLSSRIQLASWVAGSGKPVTDA
jgi:non-specific serine/threonine protein kinase